MSAIALKNEVDQFNYTIHFGSEAIGVQALRAKSHFQGFMAKTLQGLVTIGKELGRVQEQSCLQLGIEQGRKAFQDWLASEEFGVSRSVAQTAMILSQWYLGLPKQLRRLVVNGTTNWSLSALRELPKIPSELLTELVKQGKQTVNSLRDILSIAKPKKSLILGQLATEADWQLISEKYEIVEDNLESLRLEAQVNATLNTETGLLEVTTDALVKALKTFGYNPELVLPKAKSQKRYTAEEVEQIRQEITASKTVEITQIIEAKEREIQETKVAQAQLESVLAEQQKTFEQLQQQLQIQYQTEVEELQQKLQTQYQTQYQTEVEELQQQLQTQYQTEVEQLKQESSQKAILESENAYLRQRIAELENARPIPESEGISQNIIPDSEQQLANQESHLELLSPQVEQFNLLQPPLSNQPLNQVISETQISERLERENESLKQQIKELKNQLAIHEINYLNRNSKSIQKRKKTQGFAIK